VLTGLGGDVEGIIVALGPLGLAVAEGAAGSAERFAESLVAIPAQHLVSPKTSDAFGLAVEKKDSALHVVGNDPLLQAVEDMLQVVPVAQQGF
jgi:hypothetical protein